MKYRLSILNVAAGIFLAGIVVYTLINYSRLSEGEGWGVIAMVGLMGIALVLLVLDFITQLIFKSREVVNIIGAILAFIATVFLFFNWFM